MTDEYTPTTAEIRNAIEQAALLASEYVVEIGLSSIAPPAESVVAGFDRWLAAHGREVAAKALEEWSGEYGQRAESVGFSDEPSADYWRGAQDAAAHAVQSAASRATFLREGHGD